jgi:DNA-binding winged helix-turn-helix (wHTH) protein
MEHSATVITFGPFRLVSDKKELWKDEELIKIRSMSLAVLTYFAQHPERVIPIDEVRKAVWGGTQVGREDRWPPGLSLHCPPRYSSASYQ